MSRYKHFLPVDDEGYYGRFGGAYIPEILHANVDNLREAFYRWVDDEEFKAEFDSLMRDYVGRPSPLYHARRLSALYNTNIYLKREDLNHTGAHKINNAIGSSHAAWARNASSPRRARDSTAWPPPRYARSWGWSASSTWVLPMWHASVPTWSA